MICPEIFPLKSSIYRGIFPDVPMIFPPKKQHCVFFSHFPAMELPPDPALPPKRTDGLLFAEIRPFRREVRFREERGARGVSF